MRKKTKTKDDGDLKKWKNGRENEGKGDKGDELQRKDGTGGRGGEKKETEGEARELYDDDYEGKLYIIMRTRERE